METNNIINIPEGYEIDKEKSNEHKIVLTIAHMNEIIEDCSDGNLKALCQRCHNQYDAKARAEHRKITFCSRHL